MSDTIEYKSSDNIYDVFFKGSRKMLEEHRSIQSSNLMTRLRLFVQLKEIREKSSNKINVDDDHGTPIKSTSDIAVIQRISNLKTFAVIPVFDQTSKHVTHAFTVGLWYYWGIPEIMITFDPYINKDIGFMQILYNIMHDAIFSHLKSNILLNESVQWVDFKNNKYRNMQVKLTNFNSHETLELNLVDETEYMGLNIMLLMWFYMYFVDAHKDSDGEPLLFPLYRLNLTNDRYAYISRIVTDSITDKLLDMSANSDISELPISDDDCSDSDSDIDCDIDSDIDLGERDHVENCDE
jgi:hypothetical protein